MHSIGRCWELIEGCKLDVATFEMEPLFEINKACGLKHVA
jgi:hypothetical protein